MYSFKRALFVYSVCLLFLFPPRVFAYLDPGTGSYVFQLMIASILGILIFLKTSWRSVILFMKRILHRKHDKKEIPKS
jgi:hypothetical protein